MGRLIVYRDADGNVCVIHPTGDISDEEVARKDVPAGVAYLFIGADEVPTDRTFRNAWTADLSQPDGQGIGAEAWFSEQEVKKHEPDLH